MGNIQSMRSILVSLACVVFLAASVGCGKAKQSQAEIKSVTAAIRPKKEVFERIKSESNTNTVTQWEKNIRHLVLEHGDARALRKTNERAIEGNAYARETLELIKEKLEIIEKNKEQKKP